jgi:hypothetical protein
MQGRGQPALMRKSTPIRVVIPAIGVDSVLMRVGLKVDSKLRVAPRTRASRPSGVSGKDLDTASTQAICQKHH